MNYFDDASLTSIPNEILNKILDYFSPRHDTDTLLALARVSHLLNRVALTRILGSLIVDEILSHSRITFYQGSPVELAEALSIAFWIPKIATIRYKASRYDLHYFLNDIHRLILLLNRLPFGSLDGLELDATVRSSELFESRSNATGEQAPNPMRAWKDVLVRLGNAALAMGCRRLDITIDDHIPLFYDTNSHPPCIPRRRRNRVLRQITRFKPTPSSHSSNSHLGDLSITSSYFFFCPLRKFTFGLFESVSRTLQHLALQINETHSEWIWGVLAEPMDLPQLKSLTLKMCDKLRVSLKDLHSFLLHYPTITQLKLDLHILAYDRFAYVEHHPGKSGSFLPSVEILEARPRSLIWLLSLRRPLRFWGICIPIGVGRVNPLNTIRILARGYSLGDFLLNEAIHSFGNFLPPLSDTRYPPLALEISLSWEPWVAIDRTGNRWWNQPEQIKPSRVRKLTLDFSSSALPPLALGTANMVSTVADWLAKKFPELVELIIVGKISADQSENVGLRTAIIEKCPCLTELELNGERVPLR